MAVEYKKLVARLREQTYIERKGIFGEDGARKPAPASATPDPSGEPGF